MKHKKLLLIGFSNWDYYLNEDETGVMSVAKKDSGAATTYFGSVEYFTKWLLQNLSEDDKYERRLTPAGFKLIPHYQITA
ncbi:hypothetical protein QTG56_24640 (plasmid) [Rossellomorea sp. AcN35-11]|nr:hypothetical protein [Rossellomorea aquimaris]WJV31824.1 hypothetical protein QTG56_24640 [Rossellomorea sp. AcN35-11]